MPFDNYPDVMTVRQIQEALGIGRNTAYNLLNNGQIHCFHIGRTIKIPKKYLIEYIARCN